MSIVSSYTARGHHIFVDHNAIEHKTGFRRSAVINDDITNTAERAAMTTTIEEQLAEQEVNDAVAQAELGNNPDKVAEHQPQADFDRRVLGRMMLFTDVHTFYAAYPMFQAVESRGGANKNQRASYLGISTSQYDLIANRFNNVSGVAWFLNDEKNQVWSELPSEFV